MSYNSENYMFGGNREIAIQRDGEKCIKCGLTRDEHRVKYGRDITVDHMDGMGNGVPKELKNNDLSNLQTLCLGCHASKDNHHKKITYIQAINIRHMHGALTNKKIGELYGVTEQYVSQLMHNKWRKV